MLISPIVSFTASPIKTTNTIQPKQTIATQTLTPQCAPFFPDIFTSKETKALKEIKTKSGRQRYGKDEIKEIKPYIKKDKLDIETVKYFSDTMLDAKSLSEVFAFGKTKKDRNVAYNHIHKNIEKYEEPYKDWSDSLKYDGDRHTKLEFNPKDESHNIYYNSYTITSSSDTSGGTYGENGGMLNEWKTDPGPFYPYPSSSSDDGWSSSSPSTNSSSDDWLDPLNPLSPISWL